MAPFLDDVTSSEVATRLQPAPGPAAGGDDIDDILEYDAGLDDVFRDNPEPKASARQEVAKNGGGDTLGLDEEVEVARKIRAPKPKLDDNRLLSSAGIPKLRKRAKDLRLKGKGHEYSDAARLLQMYQLWLDDLFPKARFLDALSMVEREGHKRSLQSARMGWIDEGKPKDTLVEDPIFGDLISQPNSGEIDTTTKVAPIFEQNLIEQPKTPMPDDAMDDIYDATPAAARIAPVAGSINASTSIFGPTKTPLLDEPEDDLDALLAEAEMETKAPTSGGNHASYGQQDIEFDDEMEAMAGMDDPW